MLTVSVASAFNSFIQRIALSGDHLDTAETRAARIVELMEDGFEILEAFPTGSITRGTAVRSSADVDVMVVLHYGDHIENKRPKQVLEDVRLHLSQYRARIVKKNGQAVTLYFKTWPNVDIVPAAHVTGADGRLAYYIIPDMNQDRWIDTNPHYHDQAMSMLSSVDLHLIQMIKTWNGRHSSYLQSFHIEVLALLTDSVDPTDWPWAIRQFLDQAMKLIERPLSHPNGGAGNGKVDDYLTPSARREAKARLVQAEDYATRAWWETRHGNLREAMKIYQWLFGSQFPSNG